MSGGHFNYEQWKIANIAGEIECLIEDNSNLSKDSFGETIGHNFPDEVIEKFKEAAHWLNRSYEMVQRIDWLLSGDDGIESFLERWEKEVRKP